MDTGEVRDRLRERLKADYRCTQLLEKDRRGQGWICPWCGSGSHRNGTGALAYYPDSNRVQCFACGRSEDSIALYEQVRGTDHSTALEGMAREMGIETASDLAKSNLRDFRGKGGTDIAHSPKIDSGATEKPTDHTGYFAECQARLATDTEALGYLGARGIGLQTARAYGVGYDPKSDMSKDGKSGYPSPRVIIPMGRHGYVGRSIRPLRAKSYEKMIKGKMWVTAPDGLQAEDRGRPIWICEGAFDAMSICEAGGLSVSTNGIGGGKRAVDWIKSLGLTDRRYIILPDSDPDPSTRDKVHRAAEKLGADLGLLGVSTAVAQLPDFDGKDANDLLRTDRGQLKAFVEDTERTAIFLIGGHQGKGEDGRSKSLDWDDWIGTDKDPELTDNNENCAKQGSPSNPDPAELSDKEAQKSEADAFWDGQTAALTGFVDRATSGIYRGIRTGLNFWDDLTDGILPQTLTVLVAPPASGKTTLCLQLAEAMATKRPVLYANLEMSQDQMLSKSISRRTYEAVLRGESTIAMTAKEVLEGHKDGYDTERASRTLGEYARDTGARLMYLDTVQKGKDCTIEGIADGYERAAEYCKAKGMGAPILIVDYLHLVGVRDTKKANTMDIIKDVVQTLKDIAIAHDTAVIAISSTGREATAKGKMTMHSARDSSNIEYMADYFLSLDHYGYYAPKGDGKADADFTFNVDTATTLKKRPMILKIHKSRMGEAGKYKRIWLQAEYGYFTGARKESEVYGTEVFGYNLAQLRDYYKREGVLEEPTDNPFTSEGKPMDWDGEIKAEGRGRKDRRKKDTESNVDISAVLESN